MSIQATIEEKLSKQINASHTDIQNESHMHNVPDGSESHFRLVVVSEEFADMNLLSRHRTINKILKDELANGIHALALHTFTPQEWRGAWRVCNRLAGMPRRFVAIKHCVATVAQHISVMND